MSDLQSFFSKKGEERKQYGGNGGGGDITRYPFNLSTKKNQGLLIVRMVPDEFNRPVRLIYDSWETWMPQITDEGALDEENNWLFQFPAPENYNQALTPSQNALYSEVQDLLERYDEADLGALIGRTEIVFFYGKPQRFISADNTISMADEDYPLRLFRHHSRNFYKSLQSAIDTKSSIVGSPAFLENFFSRNPEPTRNLLAIHTQLGEIGYNVSVSFENSEGSVGINLTEDDLARSRNLDIESPSVTEFPEEDYVKARDTLNMMLGNVVQKGRQTLGSQPAQEPPASQTMPNQNPQQVQQQAPQQPTQAQPQQAPNNQGNNGGTTDGAPF